MQHKSLIVVGNEDKIGEHISSLACDLLDVEPGRHENHPDFFCITSGDKSSIGVKPIVELTDKLKLKPYQALNKLAVISDANKLTREAQNALLKTLEEPPIFTQIILTLDSNPNLLDTILSRCSIVDLGIKTEKKDINIENFVKMDLISKFIFVDELNKIKMISEKNDKINIFLKDLYLLYRDKLNSTSLEISNLKAIKTKIELIDQTNKYLQSNVNTKLLLENLIINL